MTEIIEKKSRFIGYAAHTCGGAPRFAATFAAPFNRHREATAPRRGATPPSCRLIHWKFDVEKHQFNLVA